MISLWKIKIKQNTMKKSVFKILNIVAFSLATLTLTNCGSDEPDIILPGNESEVIENLKVGIMNGNLDEDYTLDPGVAYNLNAAFTIDSGAKLTIHSLIACIDTDRIDLLLHLLDERTEFDINYNEKGVNLLHVAFSKKKIDL